MLAGIINLSKRSRFSKDYLLLLALWSAKFAKANGGAARMLCGVGPNGQHHQEETLRSQLLEAEAGVDIDLPDDDKGGVSKYRLKICLLGWAADLLGRAGLGPWPESFQAAHPCPDCWFSPLCECAYLCKPCPAESAIVHHVKCLGELPRSESEDRRNLDSLRLLSQTAAMKQFSTLGVNKLYHVLDSRYLYYIHYNVVTHFVTTL